MPMGDATSSDPFAIILEKFALRVHRITYTVRYQDRSVSWAVDMTPGGLGDSSDVSSEDAAE